MEIKREYTEAFVTEELEVYEAGIAMTPEVFEMLIKGIYKDKPLAAVREPIFNAIDSHVEAGCEDVPIEIHVPTIIEPWFSVRDHGLGMSKDMITKLYMNIGSSTKRKSNKLIGAKGIGSKAPFAFTDMFSVISIHNGTKTTYSVHLNKGIPNVSPTHSMDCVERNGVEIKFAVDQTQFETIRRAVRSCLVFMKSPYEINDQTLVKDLENTRPVSYTSFEADGWRMEIYPASSNLHKVVMGQQSYESKALSKMGISCAVFVNIGDCDVDPPRENTVEDEGDFVERLNNFRTLAMADLERQMQEKIDKCKDILEFEALVKEVPGWFATRFLHTLIADRLHETSPHIDPEYLTYYVKKEHSLDFRRTRKKDEKTGVLEFLKSVWLYADKRVALLARSKILGAKFGINKVAVFDTVDVSTRSLREDPFFAPKFVNATDVQLPRNEKSAGPREKGHVCPYLDDSGYLRREQRTKKEFADLKYYMTRSTGFNKGWSNLGWINNITVQANLFKVLGLKENRISVITEGQVAWLSDDAVEITLEMVKDILRKPYIWNKIENDDEYRQARRLLSNIGYKVFDFARKNMEYPYHLYSSDVKKIFGDDTGDLEYRADMVVDRYVQLAERIEREQEEKYPLLAELGFSKYNTPAVKEYREAMDFYKQKEGEK